MTDYNEQSSSVPPPAIACERVLHYAVLDSSVGFRSGHGLVSVGRQEVGRVACLAICTQKRSSKVLLQFCDGEWTPEAVGVKNSVEEAKRLAERIYPRSLPLWVEAHVTEEDADRYLDKMFEGQRCSFCNKRPDEVVQIFGNGGTTNICSECIEELHAQL
jgi:hypothetical protein